MKIWQKSRELLKPMPKKTTLEEARAIIQWLKDGKADKKERPDITKDDDQTKQS